MPSLAVIGASVAAVGAVALAVVLVPFNRKRSCIAQAAACATPAQLEHIYTLVEGAGNVASTGYVLARTNERSDEARCLIPIPLGVPGFPWAGKVVEAVIAEEVEFHFIDAATAAISLMGKVYRPVAVPRRQGKGSKKERNAFAPEKYLAGNPELVGALKTVCPHYPAELLSYLLCIGSESFEFEPIDQARIGTSPAWVQTPPASGLQGMRQTDGARATASRHDDEPQGPA